MQRRRAEEWMDSPHADPRLVRKSLAFIRRVNVLFRYNRATISHFARFSRNWKRGERITILDIATGSGDVPAAIARWATRRGFDVRIVGLDRNTMMAKAARGEKLQILQGDALQVPFADRSFDYAMTSMFLHHLSEDDAASVLCEMDRVSRRGIIAADLLRHRRAYFWISLFTLFANPMVRHDARVSVAQAFDKSEVLELRQRAAIEYAKFHRHFAHRFILAGEKGGGER